MCGVVGLFSLCKSPVAECQLRRATDALWHRGPDEGGVWLDPNGRMGLGHRRLAMNALDDGLQPIMNEDGSVIGVINGEFYGATRIRDELIRAGHRFRSECDSEIAIHLYEEFGYQFVSHLRGEFALILVDRKSNHVIAARDRFGIKPLVYSQYGDTLCIASEAKAIQAIRPTQGWDLDSLFFATSIQYLPPAKTLFAGIQLLPPGNMLVVNESGVQVSEYWKWDYPDEQGPDSGAAVEQPHCYEGVVQRTRRLLVDAVVDRCPSEVPYCFHLSGGLDSSAVLGIASKYLGRGQTAFNICFENEQYDESKLAQSTAAFCGAELKRLHFSAEDLIDAIYPSATASEGLAINGHLPAKWILNRMIRDAGFKAVLTGEGADETFLGYAHLQLDWANSTSKVSFDGAHLDDLNRSSLGMMLPVGEALSTDGLKRELGFVPTFLAAKSTMGRRIRSLVNDDLLADWNRRDPFVELIHRTIPDSKGFKHPVHLASLIWGKLALAGYILKTLGDGTEMPAGVEGRVPFLDHNLFEFVSSQPLGYFFQGQTTKWLLRDVAAPFVSREVRHRVKHPFDTPPLLLNRSKRIRTFLNDQIRSDLFRAQPIFDFVKTKHLLESVSSMKNLERQIWDPVVIMIFTLMGIQRVINNPVVPGASS